MVRVVTEKCRVCGNEYPYIKVYFKKDGRKICHSCRDMIQEKPKQEKPKKEPKPKKIPKPKNQYDYVFRKLKRLALERDGNKCVECGSDYKLNVHHIQKVCEGGENTLSNYKTLCIHCHINAHEGEPVANLMRKSI